MQHQQGMVRFPQLEAALQCPDQLFNEVMHAMPERLGEYHDSEVLDTDLQAAQARQRHNRHARHRRAHARHSGPCQCANLTA